MINKKSSSSRRLNFCNFKLDTLLAVTQSINNNLPINILLKQFECILSQKLTIGKLIVYDYNKRWGKILEAGFEEPFDEVDVENDLLPIEEITTTTAANLRHLEEVLDTIIPVFHNSKPIAYVLIGDIDEEREGVSPTIKHLRFIQTLTNIIMVAIENQRLVEENLKQEAIRKELELASKMQSMLIPDTQKFPKTDKIFAEGFYLPHFEVGGDYYDFFPLNKDEYAFCMSDVSGKGIPAAILMSNFQAHLKALFTSEITLTDLVKKLNERVLASANGEKFITLFIGKYNIKTKELKYINAGHNPPFFYNKKTGSLNYLKNGCPGMGMLDFLPVVTEGYLKMKEDSKIICYTDGLVELNGEDTTDAGMEAVANIISNKSSINQDIKNLCEDLNISKENTSFFDDVSVLGIDFFV